MSVGSVESSNNIMTRMREATLFGDDTVINLVANATSALPCLLHINKDGRDVLASNCLKITRYCCRDTSLRLISCSVAISIVRCGCIHGGVVATIHSHDRPSGCSTLRNPMFEKPERDYGDMSFSFSKAKRFNFALVEGKEQCFWFVKVLLLFHLTIQQIDKTSAESAFVRYLELTPSFDNVARVSNCLCLRHVTSDENDRSVGPNLYGDNTIDVEKWYGAVPFTSLRSVHHVVRSNCYVPPFTLQFLWPLRRFNVNRFYQFRK